MKLIAPHPGLQAVDFIALAQLIWQRPYDAAEVQEALRRTLNITAWENDRLVGCVRILSDGYFFGTVPELMVHPEYQGHGLGRQLMEKAKELSPTGLYFGAQPGKEGFYEALGFEPGLAAYTWRKT